MGVGTESPCLTANDQRIYQHPLLRVEASVHRGHLFSLQPHTSHSGFRNKRSRPMLAHLSPISTETKTGFQEPFWEASYLMVLQQPVTSVNINCEAPSHDQLVPSSWYLLIWYPPPVERQERLWLGLNHKKYQDLCPRWVHPRIKLSVINKVWFHRCTGQVIRKAHKTRLCGRMEQGPSEGFIFQAALALKFIFRHTNVLLCNKNHRDGFEGLLFRGAELPVSLGYLINSADHATKTWHYKESLSIHTFLLTETDNSGSLGL